MAQIDVASADGGSSPTMEDANRRNQTPAPAFAWIAATLLPGLLLTGRGRGLAEA